MDSRGSGKTGSSKGGAHWSLEKDGRINWTPVGAKLTFQPTRPSDRGDYRCRADFRASPSRNTRVHLQVIGEIFLVT